MNLEIAKKVLKEHKGFLDGIYVKPANKKMLSEAINIVLYAVELQQRYIKSGEIGDFEELKKL